MDALVGDTGFVGGNLLRQHDFGARYNSRNILEIAGRRFSALVFAGAQGKKWWANQNPEQDRAGIDVALDAMAGVRADRVMLISTIDVVPPVPGADEGFDCASQPNHAYGRNRLHLEAAMRTLFADVTILRLPALTGWNLGKNIVFDLMHDNGIEKIDPASRFQFYDLHRLWQDTETSLRAGLSLVHLVTEPVLTSDLVARFFPGKSLGQAPAAGSALYDFRSRKAEVFGGAHGYIYDAAEVMRRVGAHVAAGRAEASP